jgi:hypothetical protein
MHPNYDDYPLWMIAMSNALSLSIYVVGLYILAQLGIIFALFYLLYFIILEINLYRKSCVNCYYYGKLCGFGKGKMCASLFPRGDPTRFNERKLAWWNMLPDLLILILPLIGGIVSLFINFRWMILGAIIVITILALKGNEFIRRSFSCAHCKQRVLGWPAAQLFYQTNNKTL